MKKGLDSRIVPRYNRAMTLFPQENVPYDAGTAPGAINDMLLRAKYACHTMQFLNEGVPEEVLPIEQRAARTLFSDITANNQAITPQILSNYTSGTLQHLDSMLSEYDQELINVSVRLRAYVTNKLIEESLGDDPKDRIKALELLGKVKDVGLFSEKYQVEVSGIGTEELENRVRLRLEKLIGSGSLVDVPAEQSLTP